ncbi:Protein argonaute-2-like, protein [Aphelenchoides bicaudatus]|nr:Protein argonaute-2-like, protein [Aphelenchoides bicaudatus]
MFTRTAKINPSHNPASGGAQPPSSAQQAQQSMEPTHLLNQEALMMFEALTVSNEGGMPQYTQPYGGAQMGGPLAPGPSPFSNYPMQSQHMQQYPEGFMTHMMQPGGGPQQQYGQGGFDTQQQQPIRPLGSLAPVVKVKLAVNLNNLCHNFQCPKRPNQGTEGKTIALRANHFQVHVAAKHVQFYAIDIQPDKCPRKVNREIINTMVEAYGKIFGEVQTSIRRQEEHVHKGNAAVGRTGQD